MPLLVCILSVLIFCATSVRAFEPPVTCPSWTGRQLVDCAFKTDGGYARLKEVDAQQVHGMLGESGVQLTSSLGTELLRDGVVSVTGFRQISFFFPYVREVTTATLSLKTGELNHRYVAVENVQKEQKIDLFSTALLIGVSIACIPLAYLSRRMTSRINPVLIRRVGYALLIAITFFMGHSSIRVFGATGFSIEFLYLLLCMILSILTWVIGRIQARSYRYMRNPRW